MTRGEALKVLNEGRNPYHNIDRDTWCEAFNMAIEALNQQPCEDAISRQAVFDLIADYDLSMGQVFRGIHDLPSVNPQEPKSEKVIKMRYAAPEEKESVDEYVKSISKATGVDFWDLEQEPCEDCISRKDAIKIVENMLLGERNHKEVALEEMKALPSVNPQEPKTGHWIKYGIPRCGEQHYKCTSCEYYINFGQWGELYTKEFKYCPNCGARMKGGE